MGQIKFITSMVMITLFTIAIVSYTINFGNDNEAIVKLGDDPEFSSLSSSLDSDIISYKTTTNSSATSIFQTKIESQEVTTTTGNTIQQIGTIFGSFKTIAGTITNKLLGGKGSEFGIIMTGFITLMSIIGILFAWKTWIGRNPD